MKKQSEEKIEFPADKLTFTHKEAAAYCGISTRTLDATDVGSREEESVAKDGVKRKMRIYDRAELDRIKAKRATPLHKPRTADGIEVPNQFTPRPDLDQFAAQMIDFFKQLQGNLQLPPAPPAEASKFKKQDISAFKDKLILSFPQAQLLSGLPSGVLKQSLDDNKISFRKIGRRRYVLRESLEEFCREFFAPDAP